MMNERIHDEFLKILAEELIPAMGCTEPIALAYAGWAACPTESSLTAAAT